MASNAITRAYKPYLKELDVTYPQYVILMALWEEDLVSIQKIQTRTFIDPGSLTQILNKLKEKEIIEIETSDEDKRRKIVSLTQKGCELKEKAASIPDQMKCKLDTLTDEDALQLITLVDKLNTDLSRAEAFCKKM